MKYELVILRDAGRCRFSGSCVTQMMMMKTAVTDLTKSKTPSPNRRGLSPENVSSS
jgi:hypothetical protein